MPTMPAIAIPALDRALQKGIHDKIFSAVACTASVGFKPFHRNVYGTLREPPQSGRVGFDALFDLASLSKPLGAGLAALYLVGKGRMDLSAPLEQALPEFRSRDEFKNITLDMLLDHTSGLPQSPPTLWRDTLARNKTPKPDVFGTRKANDLYKRAIAELPLAFSPGSQTLYSDVGFLVLGWVIEALVNKPLDAFLEQEIYKPLSVHDDLLFVRLDDVKQQQRLRTRTFVATEHCPIRARVLQGEVHDPAAWAVGGVAGHAGLFGTLDAVFAVVTRLWAAYRGQDAFFHSGTVQRFWTRSKRLKDTTRTLAWDTPSAQNSAAGKRFSRNAVGHLGFTGTSVWIDPLTNIIGIVLANSVHPSAEGKKERMALFRPHVYDVIAQQGEAASKGSTPARPR